MTAKDKHRLDAWVQEYKDCKRGRGALLCDGPVGDGHMHIHGDLEAACAAAYVHPAGCVVPVVTGGYRRCMDLCVQAQRGEVRVWDRRLHPPPAVRIDGIDRLFTPLQGRAVVGAVEHGDAVVLLGFFGGSWALAYSEPGWSTWIIASARLGSLDLDLWRKMHPRPAMRRPPVPPPPPPPPPVDPRPAEIRQLHQRVLGRHDDDEPADEIGEVVVVCLEAQVERAPCGRQRLLMDHLVDLIVEAGAARLRADPTGTKSDVAEVFSRALGRPVCPDKLGEALSVALALGCCFVALSGRRWTLRLRELVDPKSDVHRRLLEQAGPTFDLGRATRRVRESRGGSAPAREPVPHDPPPPPQRPATAPAVRAAPAAPAVPSSSPDWITCITGLLIVASLFAASLEERAAECAELRGQAQVDHWSLKQLHERHETERQQWATEREAATAELVALRAELATVQVERDAQARDLARVRDERDAALRDLASTRAEMAERDAEHAKLIARIERLEATTGETVAAMQRQLEVLVDPAHGAGRKDFKRDSVAGEAASGAGAPHPQVDSVGAAATAVAWVLSGLRVQLGLRLSPRARTAADVASPLTSSADCSRSGHVSACGRTAPLEAVAPPYLRTRPELEVQRCDAVTLRDLGAQGPRGPPNHRW